MSTKKRTRDSNGTAPAPRDSEGVGEAALKKGKAVPGGKAGTAGSVSGLPPPPAVGYDEGYMRGFGGHFSSEAVKGALPIRGNTPQKVAFGLYAEQLSGTAFTMDRAHNQRSWLYRIKPSVGHSRMKRMEAASELLVGDFSKLIPDPNQMRWGPIPFPTEPTTFVQGFKTVAGAGDTSTKAGLSIHVYSANTSMDKTAFYNSDGDFLIVPQVGTLHITTEFGKMDVEPREICVIQRGIKFSVNVDGESRGYVLEIHEAHFELPDLGPIGANGLANPRDFLTPVAWYEDVEDEFTLVNKYCGNLWTATQPGSPFNVVAWHGNYAPYKYHLDCFCALNSVTFDHIDPSIFTVLTAKSTTPGVAVADFVIFPARWTVLEGFRPPYYHRNTMAEYMGLIQGEYDAKEKKSGKSGGFVPGGSSLHNIMEAHGPDAATFRKASTAPLDAKFMPPPGLAFMFETTYVLKVAEWAEKAPHREEEYQECWEGLPKMFDPTNPDAGYSGDGAGAGAGSGGGK